MRVPLHDQQGEVVGTAGIGPGQAAGAHDVEAHGQDLESVMQLLCAHAMELTGADGAAITLLEDGELRFAASRGTPEHRISSMACAQSSCMTDPRSWPSASTSCAPADWPGPIPAVPTTSPCWS